jgi:hypothetical protein
MEPSIETPVIEETVLPTIKRVLSVDIGIKNLAFCITDFNMDDKTFDLVCVEKACIGNVKQTCYTLSIALMDFMMSCVSVHEKPLDHILIENQVSRSIKNTVLGYTCLSHFYTLSKVEENCSSVQFISPRNKFKAIEAYFPGTLEKYDTDHCKAPSKDLKKLSIQIAKDIFTDMNITTGLEAMAEFKPKLDDVADVFLQSFGIFLNNDSPESGNPLKLKKRRKTKA